jgi:hypothetical protein
MARVIGPVEKQNSNIVPNLGEASVYAGASSLVDKHLPGKNGKPAGFAKKFFLAGVPANMAWMGTAALTGNNYADKASTGQIIGDMAGGMAGSMLGENFGKAIARNIPEKLGAKLLGGATAKAGGAVAGRTVGTMLGSLGGPLGSVAGGVLGSWLAPKLFNNADENYLEPDKGMSGGAATALAGAALLATPMGRPVRSAIGNIIPDTVKKPISEIGDELSTMLKNTELGKAYTKPFNTSPVNPEAWGFTAQGRNLKDTWSHAKGVNSAMEHLGDWVGQQIMKKKQANIT